MIKFGHEIKPGQIIIKNVDVLLGLMERRFSPLLVKIIADLAKEHGLVMTESYRSKMHRNDLHGTLPVRAVDIRSWVFDDKKAQEIKHEINRRWEYDYNRPEKDCAILHRTKNGAMHFHFQTCQNTRRRAI